MNGLLNYPLAVFAISLALLWLSIQFGAMIGRKLRALQKEERDDLGVVVNASLTLLALIIGFSFSMAVSRYDQRKNYEEEEANAIGTEYVRADLLPAQNAERVRELLKQYLEQRLLFYTLRDAHRLEAVNSDTARLQSEMWSVVQSGAAERPTPPVALAVSGMNDVLNRQGYTQAAWWNRIPKGAWSLMVTLAVCCSVLIGYDARHKGVTLAPILPFVLAVAFFLIADIDSPRSGVIRVQPQNLLSLSDSLHK